MPIIRVQSAEEAYMDIRNIGGSGGVERGGNRTRRAETRRDDASPVVNLDEARISAKSRDTAAAVEGLAARARGDDGEREAKVAAALQKLRSGELDDAAALRGTAQRLADAGFLGG
jgi:hypothetical protein